MFCLGGGSGGGFAGGGNASHFQYEVVGGNMQAIKFQLQPNQTLIGEAGCLLYMEGDIFFESRMGDGSQYNQQQEGGSLLGQIWNVAKMAGKRLLTNESLFVTWFINQSNVPRTLTVAAPFMGHIVPVDLHKYPQSTILAQSGAFLCSSIGVGFSVELVKSFGAGIFGGEGFILQRLSADQGSPGQLFMHGCGTIIKKELENESLFLDPGCLMAFTLGIDYDIDWQGGKNAMLSGNFFLTKLQGTGTVWIQSTPSNRMIDHIINKIPTVDNGGGGDDNGDNIMDNIMSFDE